MHSGAILGPPPEFQFFVLFQWALALGYGSSQLRAAYEHYRSCLRLGSYRSCLVVGSITNLASITLFQVTQIGFTYVLTWVLGRLPVPFIPRDCIPHPGPPEASVGFQAG